MKFYREEIPSYDGNMIIMDWTKHEVDGSIAPLEDDTPIIFLIHGLGGAVNIIYTILHKFYNASFQYTIYTYF
jgi:hypothetical protein